MRALYWLMLAIPLAVGCGREEEDKPATGDEADTDTDATGESLVGSWDYDNIP